MSQVFELFPQLPAELRSMVIDRMEQDDRLRFSFTSKLCNKEAKASRYIYGLELFGFGKNDWRIYVIYGKYETSEERNHGYTLDIKEDSVSCASLKGAKLWSKELDSSIDIYQYATGYFKDLLRPCEFTIKKLVICGKVFANFDFGIRCLKSIEILVIEGNADIRHFLPKIPHSLIKLEGCTRRNMPCIVDCEEFYQIQNLNLHDLKLTNQQFRKLTASHVHMRIGDLTEENLFEFIQSWQNGSFQSKSKKGAYNWILDNRKFSLRNLYSLLGIRELIIEPSVLTRAPRQPCYIIEHRYATGNVAEISEDWSEKVLKFTWGTK